MRERIVRLVKCGGKWRATVRGGGQKHEGAGQSIKVAVMRAIVKSMVKGD